MRADLRLSSFVQQLANLHNAIDRALLKRLDLFSDPRQLSLRRRWLFATFCHCRNPFRHLSLQRLDDQIEAFAFSGIHRRRCCGVLFLRLMRSASQARPAFSGLYLTPVTMRKGRPSASRRLPVRRLAPANTSVWKSSSMTSTSSGSSMRRGRSDSDLRLDMAASKVDSLTQ